VLRARLGPGEPLAGNTGAAIGGVFGQDFSDVRIHRDGMADTLASGLSARAFTVGSHIAFAAGEHQPGTPVGDALIAHELAHVAQQHQGAAAGVQTRGDGDESALEADADRAAVSAVVALRGGKDRLATWAKTIGPNLRSGLRLLRCNRSNEPPKPDPGPVPTPEQVTAHAAAMNQLLGDPVANVAAIKAKLAEMGPYGGHILLKVLMLRNRPQMGAIAGTPPGPEIIRGLIESLRTGDYAAFSAQLRPNGEDPGNIVERDSGRILADDLERLLNQMNQPAPAGDKDTQAELARVNAAIAADARMSDYKAAGLIFPISLYQPGTERDAGLYYDPTLITEGMTSPIYLSKGDRRPIVISIRIGRKALKEESGAERSDAFVRSTLNHEFVHFKQYLDFRNKNLDSDERVDQLRVDDVAEDKGEAGPSADVEAITAQLVNDIATLGDPDVRGLLRYMSEKWNFAFPSFRDRAIVAMKDQGHPLGAKDGVQMKRMLGLIKGMGLHAGKKRKKGEPPGKDLASLYQALGGT
ncbi:MAG TPA: DUF4157 domain-containing protein, partial [Thermomicrobiales bacterium]|nr:DUF4157 domain-containing protein [Thermomicrobiales bacterium]